MLTSVDLLAPVGELQPALFPMMDGAAVAALLDGYITQAYLRADAAAIMDPAARDNIARAGGYSMSYQGALQRIVSTPTSVSLTDKGSSAYSAEQLKVLERRAQYWQDLYDELVVPPVEPIAGGGTSGSTRNHFVF